MDKEETGNRSYEMSSRERLRALFSGSKPDRVPVIPFAMSYSARVAGISLKDYYLNPEKSFEAQRRAAAMIGYDGGPTYGYASVGGWEFGGEVLLPEEGSACYSPTVLKCPIQTHEDVQRLRIPDPKAAGCYPLMMEFARICRANGLSAPFQAGTPFTFAGNATGPERLMLWMLEAPNIVHMLLEKVTDFLIAAAEWFVGEFGGARCAASASSTIDSNMLISPEQFRTFSLPYICKLHERVLQMGVRSFFVHLCGDHSKNLPIWRDVPLGQPGVVTLGSQVDIAYARQVLGDKCILAGNIDTGALLAEKPEAIVELCRQAIEKGKDSPRGFILMASCELAPGTPIENVMAMIEAARRYGRY